MARRLVHLLCLAVALTGLAVAPASAITGIDDGMIPLPGAVSLVPDPVHGTVWARGYDGIWVVDVGTETVREVPIAGDPTDLSLDPEGDHAYVTWGSSVSVIDTSTLAIRTLDLGPDSCPTDVAGADGLIHLTDHCHANGPYRAVDATDGSPRALLAAGTPIGVPGRHRVLFWLEGRLTVVDTTTATVIAERTFGTDIRTLTVSSDGRRLLLGDADRIVRVRDVDTLSGLFSTAEAGSSGIPDSLDIVGELLLVSDYNGLEVLDLETDRLVNRLWPWQPEMWDVASVTTADGRVVALARHENRWALFLEDQPVAAAPDLDIVRKVPPDPFTPTTVEGTLTSAGVGLSGEPVILTRPGQDPITVVTDAAGHFSTDLVFASGTTVVARWAGGAGLPPAITSAYFGPLPADTLLTVDTPARVAPSETIPVTVHLRTARGADLAGYEVLVSKRCRDGYGWTALEPVMTGADGRATLEDSPLECLEVEYAARHEATPTTRASSAEDTTSVSWTPSALELTVPEALVPGDTATVSVRLLVDGEPAASRVLTLTTSEGGVWERVTDAQGRATVNVTFPWTTRLTWQYEGATAVLPASANATVLVKKLDTALAVTTPTVSVPVTQTFTASGRLLDEDGTPVVGAEVRLGVDGPVVGTTEPDGTVDLTVTPTSWDPHHAVRLSYAGDERHSGSSGVVLVDVRPLTSSVSLDAGAGPVSVDHPVVISGDVSTEIAADADDVQLRVWRTEPDGNITELPWLDVAGDGTFSFTDHPPRAGTVAYTVTRLRNERYVTSEAETSVEVVEQVPVHLSLSTDSLIYTAGDRATVSVSTDLDTTGTLKLVAHPAEGPEVVLHDGPITTAGVTVKLRLLTNTTVSASLSEALDRTGDTVSAERKVRLGTVSTLKGGWGRKRGVWLVSPSIRPRILTEITPARADVCLVYELQQQRRNGSWTHPELSGCRTTDSGGVARHRLGRQPLGTTWRARPVARRDAFNTITRGDYVVFRIRRQS